MLRQEYGSLGAGGPGGSRLPGEDRDEIAYGSRPAVPERLLTEGGWSLEARPERMPPHAAMPHELEAFTYGRDPRQAMASYDPLLAHPNAALPSTLARRGQMIPPLPAPQEVCIVNAFNPAWGVPPSMVQGLAMPFDVGLGAYRFDPSYSLTHGDVNGLLASKAYRLFGDRWKQGLMLQPYKADAGGRWRYRWIPRVRNVVCGGPAPGFLAPDASAETYSRGDFDLPDGPILEPETDFRSRAQSEASLRVLKGGELF